LEALEDRRLLSAHVIDDALGRPEMFHIESTNLQVQAQTSDANGTFAAPAPTSVGAVKEIELGHDTAGHPEVFAIGLDDQIYAETTDGAGHWSGYALTSTGQVKNVQVGRDAAGRPEAFVRGLDDQVYAETTDGAGHWSGYALTSGGRVKDLRAGE